MHNQRSGQSEVFRSVKSATAGRSGAQPLASTERARIAPEGLGLDGLESNTLPAAPGGSETHPRRMPRGERLVVSDTSAARMYVEIHLNCDTLDARHCYVAREKCLGFHEGFTNADLSASWYQTFASPADAFTEAQIQAFKGWTQEAYKTYWRNLIASRRDQHVVYEGTHFVLHEAGARLGYGGPVYKVDWFDKRRAPTLCNLADQRKVPAWLRAELPDNAVISEVGAVP